MYQIGAVRKCVIALAAILFSSLAILALRTQCLYAQFPFSQQSTETALIEPPREVSRLLSEARKEIANSNWSVATKALGLVLGIESESSSMEGGGQDYFLVNDEKDLRNTVHQAARTLFNSIPPAGQETVEIRYGIQAEQEITEAAKNSDWHKIDYLAAKYIMTKFGRQAAFLAAEHQATIGNSAWAAARWESLIEWNAARKQFGPTLGLAAASAWKAADQPQRAKDLLSRMSKLFETQSVELNGTSFNLQNVEDTYAKLSTEHLLHRSEKQSAPNVQGGSADRNADSFAGLPLPFVSWHSLMHESSQHEDRARETIKNSFQSSSPVSLIPSRSGIVVPPHLIVMTYDQRIHGINLQTGALEWVSAFAGNPRYFSREFNEFDGTRRPAQDDLVLRIWGQKSMGQLSTDSRLIFAVVDQPSIETAENLQRGVNATIATPQPQQDYNVLQAYSIPQQAALAWEVGGETGLAEPELANVLFLGPPLPVNEELFVIGELNGEVSLFSLNPVNGKLLWKQQLAANNSTSVARDTPRRNFGCSPSYYGGILFCPTLSSELVAVDPVSRSLLWARHYQSSTEPGTNRMNVWAISQPANFNPLMFRSSETSVIVGNGVAIYAPPDSSEIFAINIYDGTQLWKQPDGHVEYVGCIVDDCVVVSKGDSVVGLELHSGKVRWTSNLIEYGRIVGRLARNGNSIFVPLAKQTVVQLNAADGKQIGTMRVEDSLGNLLATNDSLVSVSPVSITCYPIRDYVSKRVQEDLAGQKDSPNALARLAEIALSESNIESAFKLSLEAYKKSPTDSEIRSLLRKISLNAISQNSNQFLPAVLEIGDLMEEGPQRDAYAQYLVRGLLAQKKYDQALERLVSLSLSRSDDLHSNELGQTKALELGDNHTVLEGSWIAATFDRLFENASEDSKMRAFARIKERFQADAKAGMPISLLERYTRYVPEASSLRLHRAVSEYSSKSYFMAEYFACQAAELAERLSDTSVSERIRHHSDLLRLFIYRDAGRTYAVVQLANKLKIPLAEVAGLKPEILATSDLFEGMPKIHLTSKQDNQSSTESISGWQNELTLSRYVDASTGWQDNEVVVKEAEASAQATVYGELICRLRSTYGDALQGWDAKLTNNSLQLSDPTFLSSLYLPVDSSQSGMNNIKASCFYVNSLVLVQRENEFVAIDTLSSQLPSDDGGIEGRDIRSGVSTLWSQNLGASNSLGGSSLNMRVATRDSWEFGAEKANSNAVAADQYGLIVTTSSTISCIDYLFGETVWTVKTRAFDPTNNNAKETRSAPPWVSYKDGKVYAIDPIGKRRLILDARDGEVLDVATIPVSGSIWNVYQDTFLTFKQIDGGKLNFKQCSIVNGESLLNLDVTTTDKVELSKDVLLCWGESGLTFWNLKDRTEHKYDIAPGERIGNLRVQPFQDLYLMIGYSSNNKREYLEKNNSTEFQDAHGKLLAIDAKTGEPKWKEPIDSYFSFPVHQPRNSPAFVLTRHLRHSIDRSTVNTASVAIVDLKSGGLIYQNDYLPSAGGTEFQATFVPQEHLMTINYRSVGLEIKWTDKKLDPREQVKSIGDTSKKELLERMPERVQNQIKESQNNAPEPGVPLE